MKRIDGRTALITGAAGGIGRATAQALARQGARLVLLDRDHLGLAQVVNWLRDAHFSADGFACDLADPAELSDTLTEIVRFHGAPHIVVNNAGIASYGPLHEMGDEEFEQILAVNLLAATRIIRQLLPSLLAHREAHVVNVCSMLGLFAFPKGTAYQTSKSGLIAFSESLRAEYGSLGLGVTALCPGFVQTELIDHAYQHHPRKRPPKWSLVSPDYVAHRVVKAIVHNTGLDVCTRLGRALWSLKRLSPTLFASLARRRYPSNTKSEFARSAAAARLATSPKTAAPKSFPAGRLCVRSSRKNLADRQEGARINHELTSR